MTYVIIDRHTNERVGKPYSSYLKALRRADKLDGVYGGYRFIVVRREESSK